MLSILLGNFEVEDFLFDGEADTAMAMAFLVAYVILGMSFVCPVSVNVSLYVHRCRSTNGRSQRRSMLTTHTYHSPPNTTPSDDSGDRDAEPPHRHRLARL